MMKLLILTIITMMALLTTALPSVLVYTTHISITSTVASLPTAVPTGPLVPTTKLNHTARQTIPNPYCFPCGYGAAPYVTDQGIDIYCSKNNGAMVSAAGITGITGIQYSMYAIPFRS